MGILTLCLISCDRPELTSTESNSPGIVGGNSFSAQDTLPSHVVLIKTIFTHTTSSNKDFSYCSGVLVENHFVLTAAHCLKFDNVDSYEVHFPLSQKQVLVGPEQIKIHRDYTTTSLDRDYDRLRDIAVINLNLKIPAPYSSLKILPQSISVGSKVSFAAIGFGEQQGSILKKPAYPLELKFISLETENFSDSTPYFEVMQNRKGICFGDSGGPAVVQLEHQDYILGIAVDVLFNPSRVFEANYDRCLEKAVFLNVRFFREWLKAQTSNAL